MNARSRPDVRQLSANQIIYPLRSWIERAGWERIWKRNGERHVRRKMKRKTKQLPQQVGISCIIQAIHRRGASFLDVECQALRHRRPPPINRLPCTVAVGCRMLQLLLLAAVLVVMPLMRSCKQTPTYEISPAISYSFKNALAIVEYHKETHGATYRIDLQSFLSP